MGFIHVEAILKIEKFFNRGQGCPPWPRFKTSQSEAKGKKAVVLQDGRINKANSYYHQN